MFLCTAMVSAERSEAWTGSGGTAVETETHRPVRHVNNNWDYK